VLVLVIDASSPAVTAGLVALDDAPRLLAGRAPIAPRGHGELLSPAIAECLHDADAAPRGLAAVVAGIGPGPYTGLRVGLVTAAALGHALAIPTYGVCSLDAIAAACADEASLIVATDARRREVYWARYAHGRRIGEPAVSRPVEITLDGATAVAGTAPDLYPDAWPGLVVRAERYPNAVHLAALAADRIRRRAPSEPLVPLYLRHPDATVPGAPKAVSQR
jgi:tRNA threonylcarbamoyl adenosine modification protein YeaZ